MSKQKKRILVIEDEVEICAIVSELLVGADFEVQTANNGIQGLAALREFVPDLILLDLTMPEMDGLTFRKTQLAHARWAQIPTVLMSAGQEDIELPIDGYVKKPFEIEELLASVQKGLKKSEKSQAN